MKANPRKILVAIDPNGNSIYPCCDQPDVTPSVVVLQGYYGSAYDTERMIVTVCGECFDKVFKAVQRKIPTKAIKTDFIYDWR